LSIHCWQGDDVGGFEAPDSSLSGGGIQVTGNYPGKARNIAELRSDLDTMYGLIPGRHRLNLHASYGEFGGKVVDRDRIEPAHFTGWAAWAKERKLKLDFNCTCFSHPKANDGFTLSSKDPSIRSFWIEHVKRAREISAYLGKEQGGSCIHNVWLPDGTKDYPVDRLGMRKVLERSLDEVFAREWPESQMKDAVESKLFGIGSEAFVVGSHEFYLGYAISRNKLLCIDSGHFHPTELVADKISAVLPFVKELLLHVSRPMRWDSDHIVILNDDVRMLSEEIVRSGRLADIHIGLDFFDATVNRIGAWSVGARAALKSLLAALLQPQAELVRLEEGGDLIGRLVLLEELKTLPLGFVWDYYCERSGVPAERELMGRIRNYEASVTSRRG
ncbi:MAG TPA: L-rhamnose isomerase, partial [Spirochaetia bacterium]|nr:L-rhamnose isomerase [Spirochaetia bacterium]